LSFFAIEDRTIGIDDALFVDDALDFAPEFHDIVLVEVLGAFLIEGDDVGGVVSAIGGPARFLENRIRIA
jgi:hypothetical protein